MDTHIQLEYQFFFFFQMEQLSDEELDHGAEEDSDKEDQDLDKMFGAWLGELDKLTQVREFSSSCRIIIFKYYMFLFSWMLTASHCCLQQGGL